MKRRSVRSIVVIADTHFSSTLGLCHPDGVQLDDGGRYMPSKLQLKLWDHWTEFWDWVRERLNGEPYVLVHNGDLIDGFHHRTTTLASANLKDQELSAINTLRPHVKAAAAYYQIRGTEAHAGQSADSEERIASALGAVLNPDTGQHSWWELWMELGPELIHFAHHIGTTSSTAYESSAPMREIVAGFVEAGQFKGRAPSILVRSHRHRYIEVKPPNCRIIVTPGWQAKTPFVFKVDRLRTPMFGGIIIRLGEEGVHIREKIFTVQCPSPIKLG